MGFPNLARANCSLFLPSLCFIIVCATKLNRHLTTWGSNHKSGYEFVSPNCFCFIQPSVKWNPLLIPLFEYSNSYFGFWLNSLIQAFMKPQQNEFWYFRNDRLSFGFVIWKFLSKCLVAVKGRNVVCLSSKSPLQLLCRITDVAVFSLQQGSHLGDSEKLHVHTIANTTVYIVEHNVSKNWCE